MGQLSQCVTRETGIEFEEDMDNKINSNELLAEIV